MAETIAIRSDGPIRGTQSFVGVMTDTWKRRSLTGLEILWRWAVGIPIVALAIWRGLLAFQTVKVDTAALQAITVFKPIAAFQTIHVAMAAILPAIEPIAMWLLPLAFVAWELAAAFGRTLVLRRLDRSLHARPFSLLVLGVLRTVLLTAAWALWLGMIVEDGRFAITGPAGHGGQPDIVLYASILICGTLVLYVLWAIVSWPFQLAPLLAMQKNIGPLGALAVAFRSSAVVRSQLMEVNLVMNIVKLILVVLAMVLSTTPLAFSVVQIPILIDYWWVLIIVLYMLAMDYFHVVHTAAQLTLWRAHQAEAEPSAHTELH